MKEWLLESVEESGNLSAEQIALRIGVSVLLGVVIYLSYWYTHVGTAYSRKFNTSLAVLTILTATVMTVIGNNIALSLGMVGALSIVRFRTAIKDSRDTTYIFWAIVVGICCGAGDFVVSGIGSAAVFVVLLCFGRVRNDNRILLIVRAVRSVEQEIEKIVFADFNKKAVLKVKNTTPDSVEMIYELTKKAYKAACKKELFITDELYRLKEVDYVNIVTQSDEISG